MPKAAVLYHYQYPDDVVSARLFDGLSERLAARGWEMTALPCNRESGNESRCYRLSETWQGVTFRRVWRPPLKQASTFGRLCNAAWMISAWSLTSLKYPPDVLIIGTDPILSVLVARVWRHVHPRVVIAHWCYDLYPEAAIADGLLRQDSALVKFLRKLLRPAYRSCDLVVDIGSCMRERISAYDHQAKEATLVPWALYEPPTIPPVDENVRLSLFRDSKLGLMYSGNFGRAHSYQEFLELARSLRGESIHFSFGIRGNAAQQLKEAITPQDTNISLAGFAPESELQQRLVAPDIHMVSLKPEWTGTVVPSKFFGSLAVGRPVLFAGSKDSSIARWINEFKVGWVISDRSDLEQVAQDLKELSKQPEQLRDMQERCHRVYWENFSMNATIDRWDELLRGLVERKRESP